ncbi:hypothetical protein ALC56_03033 [Trachymyrmex septentrionalis]|uniref:Uncharacterized protein n=1 Tax=Trachymyrmex septentrionalis TaxID=34720 RepID=A0A195FQC2_9HYME|nr:hypothetical protein ALC56_03033 [Trachymyrmex septentrionalis]
MNDITCVLPGGQGVVRPGKSVSSGRYSTSNLGRLPSSLFTVRVRKSTKKKKRKNGNVKRTRHANNVFRRYPNAIQIKRIYENIEESITETANKVNENDMRVLFSDEASFHNNGQFNRHNCNYPKFNFFSCRINCLLEEIDLATRQKMWWQQDGAPPYSHYIMNTSITSFMKDG